MIALEYRDAQGKVSQEEWDESVAAKAQVLREALAGEARYRDSLGWLDPEEWAPQETLASLEALAAEIRQKAEVFVLVGVGGSNNAARAAIKAFRQPGMPEIVYLGNTLSPYAIAKALERLEGKSVYVNCIAKNFETLEPGAGFRALRAFLERAYGRGAAERIAVTGTPGSLLERLARQEKWRFLTFPPNIGGRFTALSTVGLLPMAVAGLDIRALVQGAKTMRREFLAADPGDNPAWRYACLRDLLYRKGYRLEMLSTFEPRFRWFFKWWVQLFAESEGKDGKGLFPVAAEYSEELHSMGQYVQEGSPILFETFLSVKESGASLVLEPSAVEDGFAYLDGKDFEQINQAALEATRRAHSAKLPCLDLRMDRLDAERLGALFYFFQFACYLSARLLGVDPFNQPGVEAYKKLMFDALGK